jgi:hypothetical protein
LYAGVQKKRGARRKYDGKVDLSDPSKFTLVGDIEPGVKLYTEGECSEFCVRGKRLVSKATWK